MTDQNQTIPTFESPNAKDLFLGSSFGLHSYGDLYTYERFFLQFLIDFEHDLEQPVGFLADSIDTLIFAVASCWRLGIPFVCFDTRATGLELESHLKKIEPGLLFVDKANSSKIKDKEYVVNIKQLDLTRALNIELNLGERAENFTPDHDPERIFGYFFTSGTSGLPKIVPLKRRQMYFAAKASADNFRPRTNHFWLLCLPLNHIGGIAIILRSLLYGSAIFRMNSFHQDMISTFLTENKLFQAASLVPTMLKRLLEIPGFHVHNDFKAILLGGGPIDSDLLQKAIDKGVPLVPSYGMTETCAQIAANPIMKPSGTYGPLRSVGKLFPPNQIQIRNEDGKPMSFNNSGNIWLKGPQIFDGYLDETLNNLAFDDNGWFNTGDFGYFNANNQLFIESRRSDLIVTGGENVSPYEVELELKKIDFIADAVVFGMPDQEWGQKVVAVVVAKRKQDINRDKILKTLEKSITTFKIPKEIKQVDCLPRTNNGKIQRSELLKFFESD